MLGSNGEERGREWSRLCLRGREEAVARVLACAGEPTDGWARRAVRRQRAAVRLGARRREENDDGRVPSVAVLTAGGLQACRVLECSA